MVDELAEIDLAGVEVLGLQFVERLGPIGMLGRIFQAPAATTIVRISAAQWLQGITLEPGVFRLGTIDLGLRPRGRRPGRPPAAQSLDELRKFNGEDAAGNLQPRRKACRPRTA